MRIIAGQWRGRKLGAPAGDNTRPILDRAKTVLFDMLGHRLAEPGSLPPIAVLDLYAGSGAIGLEALSRGAAYALFVEKNRSSAAILRSNLDALGVIREANVVEGDAAVVNFPSPAGADAASQFRLVFFDPPYRLLEARVPDRTIARLLRRLVVEPVIAPDALFVTRHERVGPGAEVDLAPLIEEARRDVGTITLRLLRRPQ
jgi:16S rRNA (guanine966-N2)-methyltransferase